MRGGVKYVLEALLAALLGVPGAVAAAPVLYRIDPNHTHPLFEVDHFGGLSVWRGLFKATRGTIALDREQGTGRVDVLIDIASIDLAHEVLDHVVLGAKIGEWNALDAEHYPTAAYRGTLDGFVQGVPTRVSGELTLHGVTRAMALTITSFKCIPVHPIIKREVCGADAVGTFNRADFGVNAGLQYGYYQEVTLRIQVEAIREE